MHAKRGGSANLAACPPHNQHPIIDCASYITPTPSLNTTNPHRDSVHLLHSRLHNSTYFPLIIDTPSEQQLQLQPSTPGHHHHGFLRISATARPERLQCPEQPQLLPIFILEPARIRTQHTVPSRLRRRTPRQRLPLKLRLLERKLWLRRISWTTRRIRADGYRSEWSQDRMDSGVWNRGIRGRAAFAGRAWSELPPHSDKGRIVEYCKLGGIMD
jgi:hypothetical protein